MFSFWVNDTTVFPVTQAWHLHTVPALIIVKSNFDYFTPFKNILWQFFSLESKLLQPPFLTLFSPSSSMHHMLLSQHDWWFPLGPIHSSRYRWLRVASHGLKSVCPSFSWKKIPAKSPLFPSLASPWFLVLNKHFYFLYLKSFHSLFKNFMRNKAIEKSFQIFLIYENIKTSLKYI